MLQLLLRRGGAAEKSMTFLPKWKAERMSPAGPAAALGAASNALSTEQILKLKESSRTCSLIQTEASLQHGVVLMATEHGCTSRSGHEQHSITSQFQQWQRDKRDPHLLPHVQAAGQGSSAGQTPGGFQEGDEIPSPEAGGASGCTAGGCSPL